MNLVAEQELRMPIVKSRYMLWRIFRTFSIMGKDSAWGLEKKEPTVFYPWPGMY